MQTAEVTNMIEAVGLLWLWIHEAQKKLEINSYKYVGKTDIIKLLT